MEKTIAPSGQQIEITFGDQTATIVEVGGGLREYKVGGRAILDGYRRDEICTGARGQLLIPWPNRIEDGQYEFDGESHQLDLSEPDRRNAIHGLVRFESWNVIDRARDRVTLEHLLYPKPGYPFILTLRIEYTLSGHGLQARVFAKNIGERVAPFAFGTHPYLCVGTPWIDSAELQIPADKWLPTNARGLPIGRNPEPVEGTLYDFRNARTIGNVQIDYTFTELQRDQSGKSRVQLRDPNSSGRVSLWVDTSFPFLEIFTGENLHEPERRRRGLGVEPMTCAPNGFRSREGLIRLRPGETWSGAWGIEPR